MSTFNGYVKEFPHLAIDFFRPRGQNSPPVHTYLLSHVHSDHLNGLENVNFGGGFIYCSEITKVLLLQLQSKESRIRYENGMLDKPDYKYGHLQKRAGRTQNLLKVLPLNRPSRVEVGHETLTVTLLDANHCPGAVMFLIESPQKCILYTGDVRAESSFLVDLKNNIIMLPYFSGVRVLDCIYLDTSARIDGPDYDAKQKGCAQLIQAISHYPEDTCFNIITRCLGYEQVFVALARSFGGQIHVDNYTYQIFKSVASISSESRDATVFDCLTTERGATRFHACPFSWQEDDDERKCSIDVRIKPVNCIKPSAQPDTADKSPPKESAETDFDGDLDVDSFPAYSSVESIEHGMPEVVHVKGESLTKPDVVRLVRHKGLALPRTILFPFARHSSWREQRELVEILCPWDVQSCTGESSHLYAALCRQSSTFCESSITETMYTGPHDRTLRRQAMNIARHAESAKGDWAKSPRIERKRLADDVYL